MCVSSQVLVFLSESAEDNLNQAVIEKGLHLCNGILQNSVPLHGRFHFMFAECADV